MIALPVFPQYPITSPGCTLDPFGNSLELKPERWA